jgi:hypothetical protein
MRSARSSRAMSPVTPRCFPEPVDQRSPQMDQAGRRLLQPVDAFVGGMLFLPATPEVIAGFIAEAEAAREELSTIANVMTAPPMPFIPAEHHGKLVLMAFVAYAGAVEDGGPAEPPPHAQHLKLKAKFKNQQNKKTHISRSHSSTSCVHFQPLNLSCLHSNL